MNAIYIVEPGGEPTIYSEQQVLSLWKQGGISSKALYWFDGMPDWRPARELFNTTTAGRRPMIYVPARGPIPFANEPKTLTRFLKVMLWISLCLAGIGVLVSAILLATGNAGRTHEEGLKAFDIVEVLLALVRLLVYIITGVSFLMWIHQANRNARALGAEGMKFTPGWAVGWYFVPILNLWKPYQAMKEIWQASRNPHLWETEQVPSLVGNWWVLWLLINPLGLLSFGLVLRAKTSSHFLTSEIVSLFSDMVAIALCVMAIRLVTSIYRMQIDSARR